MPATEREQRTIPFLVLVVSLLIVAMGIQFWRSEAARDAEAEAARDRDAADRRYADCLTDFASGLVDTIDARTQANGRLERAQQRLDDAKDAKEAATDRVFTIVLLARRTPPEATEAEFDRALEVRDEAARSYAEVRRQVDRIRGRVEEVRDQNPYVKPEVVCSR